MERILKVLVGSRAHGLETEDSDWDYRGVFVEPTEKLIKLNESGSETNWSDEEDYQSWEIKKFLKMATESNPATLEVFNGPIEEANELGKELYNLFEHVWDAKKVMNSHLGYGGNQRKKFLDNKDDRAPKFACAWLRSVYQAHQLLTTGDFPMKIKNTEIGDKAFRFKQGNFEVSEVVDTCLNWEQKLQQAYEDLDNKKTPDYEVINNFLIKVRKEYM